MRIHSFLILLLLFCLVGSAQAEPTLRVVSSIKPLQLIVAAVAGERVDNQLLLPATVSPHLYQLRPSDRRRLAAADRVFWVGPELERFLLKPLALLGPGRAVALQANPALVAVEAEELQAEHEEEHGHHQHHDGDPHIWLNPVNALVMAEQVANELMALDPGYQASYQANLMVFHQQLMALDQQLRSRFSAVQQGYILLHDGYSHFEQHYGLQHVAAVTVNPERKPGARQLLRIQQHIESGRAGCVFQEPQYQQSSLVRLLAELDVSLGQLDPLATNIAVSPQGYVEFIQRFAASFLSCLQAKH